MKRFDSSKSEGETLRQTQKNFRLVIQCCEIDQMADVKSKEDVKIEKTT